MARLGLYASIYKSSILKLPKPWPILCRHAASWATKVFPQDSPGLYCGSPHEPHPVCNQCYAAMPATQNTCGLYKASQMPREIHVVCTYMQLELSKTTSFQLLKRFPKLLSSPAQGACIPRNVRDWSKTED